MMYEIMQCEIIFCVATWLGSFSGELFLN